VAISELSVMADHLGAKTKTNLDAISGAQCVDEISQIGSLGTALTTANLKDLTRVAVDCAAQVVDLGALSALQGALAVMAGIVAAVFETAFLGASIVVGGLAGPSAVITTAKHALPTTPTTAQPPTPMATETSSLVGFWYTHAGGLTIKADGTGTLTWPDYGATAPDGSVLGNDFHTDTFSIVSSTTTSATITITSTSETYPGADPGPPVGSTFHVVAAPPGVTLTGPGAAELPTAFCDQANAANDQCGA
jgi:hypothetical protein